MAIEKVSGRVYADTTGENGGNHGVIVLKDEIIAVDAGMFHPRTAAMKDKLDEEFSLPVRKLLYTHYHTDHVFGGQAYNPRDVISSIPTRDICIKRMEEDWTRDALLEYASEVKEDRPELWEAFQDLDIRLPDTAFKGDAIFGEDDDIIFRWVGGHTAGSSIVIVEPEHVVFASDLIFHESFPYAGDPTCEPNQWIAALEEIESANYDEVIPGHGVLCGTDGVKQQLKFLRDFKDAIKKGIAEGKTPEEFIKDGSIPDYYLEGAEWRIESSVAKWFEYYK
jgi:cyclase